MSIKKSRFLFLVPTIFFITALPIAASAAIQYGDTTTQSPYAATTTNNVDDLLNKVAKDGLGATSATDVGGIVAGTKNIFVRINDWLRDKAGIDFFGILKAIGHGSISVIGFIFDLVRKAL